MKRYFVYILTNYTRTTFYVGVTNSLRQRLFQHMNGFGSKFCQRYNLKYLVYFEEFSSVGDAIAREKQLKNWHRDWKINLIRSVNPGMKDLREELLSI
jgi:putative endonuclease